MIRNGKSFIVGLIMTVTFFLTLGVIYSPVFNGMNGLQYADKLFNSLAKGSTYFIPEVRDKVSEYAGKPIEVNLKMGNQEDAAKTAILFEKAGMETETSGARISLAGDIGTLASAAVTDADAMFNNQGDILTERYGYYKKDAMYHWWLGLEGVRGALEKQNAFEQAAFLGDVVKKAVEPAYNFFGVKPEKVGDHAGMLSVFLLFYIVYTIWWGFAIFFLFEGIGLTMTKAAKQEV